MVSVTPDSPVFSCPPKENRHARTAAPSAPAAVTLYCTRLSPCTHSPHACTAGMSLTTAVSSAAVGFTDAGT